MSNDLKTLFPAAKKITIAGKALTLTPMRFAQFAEVLDHVEPIAPDLLALAQGETVNFIALLVRTGKHLIPLAAILSGQPEKWIAELPLDEAARLLGALFELNRDFFSTQVLPALAALVEPNAGAATTGASGKPPSGKTKRTPPKAAGARS